MSKLSDWLAHQLLDESIDIPVEIGDTILMGRFKNKRVVVKTIDFNEKGDLLINGRSALKFRIVKKVNENKDEIEVIQNFLTKHTKSAKKASSMIKKYYKKVKKQFRGDSTRDIAMAIVGYDVIGENKELVKMYTQAMKMMPGSPKQKELIKKISSLRKKLKMDEGPRKPRKKGQHRQSSSHSDLYTDENPKGTIKGLKFATVKDAKASVSKIKNSGKSHAHKIQAAVAMEQRAREMGKASQAAVYRAYINKMKEKTKKKNEDYTFGKDWIPTSLAQRKKMKKLHNKSNRSLREGKEDVVVVYSGRFQPFHIGHYSTYKKLTQKFGKDKVFIGTSNKTAPGRSPLNFKEKKKIITKFFPVSPKMVVQVKNPYSPQEILSKFPEDTTYIAAVGEKDSQRLKGKYFKPYKTGNTIPYKEGGFVLAVPPTGFKVRGKPVSGTMVRAVFGGSDKEEQKELFTKMYGKFDSSMYKFMINKFDGKINEASDTTKGNLDDGPPTWHKSFADYEKYTSAWLQELWGDEDWKYVASMINAEFDPIEDYTLKYSTVPAVSYLDAGSVKGSKDAVDKYEKFVGRIADDVGWEVIKWLGSDKARENLIGKVLSAGISGDKERQHDIKENLISSNDNLFIDKELLLMGGAYGHLAHPFDDNGLTFRDLKTMIDLALQGKLESVSEKTDGQNLMISYIDGKVRAARNKGHIKQFGKNSLDISGIKNMFSGRGEIEKAFTYAMKDLEIAIKKLGKKDLEDIFGNGKSFMSLEVMYVPTTNVIPYGINMLVFHGTISYNEKGEPTGQDKSAGAKLSKMIKKVNANVQRHFDIESLPNTKLPKVKDYEAKKSTFLNRVNKLQKQYGLADSDTAGDYHQHYWLEYILAGGKASDNPNPTDKVMYGLVKRWAFFDKSYKIPTIKKDLKEYPKFLEWVLATDKIDHTKMWKQNVAPFEKIFLDLGAEVLSNMENFLSANPTKAALKMRQELAKTIKKIRSSNDLRTMDMMKSQLQKVQSMGGFKKIVPTEGITFMFKGKVYKLTGLFAPINQILGMLKYTR